MTYAYFMLSLFKFLPNKICKLSQTDIEYFVLSSLNIYRVFCIHIKKLAVEDIKALLQYQLGIEVIIKFLFVATSEIWKYCLLCFDLLKLEL